MWLRASLEGHGGPVYGLGRGGLGQASGSHTPECAPSVMRVGRGVGPEGEGCTDPFLRWGQGNSHRPSVPPVPRGLGATPPPTFQTWPETPHSFLRLLLLLPVTAKDNKLCMAHLLR